MRLEVANPSILKGGCEPLDPQDGAPTPSPHLSCRSTPPRPPPCAQRSPAVAGSFSDPVRNSLSRCSNQPQQCASTTANQYLVCTNTKAPIATLNRGQTTKSQRHASVPRRSSGRISFFPWLQGPALPRASLVDTLARHTSAQVPSRLTHQRLALRAVVGVTGFAGGCAGITTSLISTQRIPSTVWIAQTLFGCRHRRYRRGQRQSAYRPPFGHRYQHPEE